MLLLLAAYAAATWFPQPGLWLREINLFSASIQPPQLLLAALLFSAGLCASPGAVKTIGSAKERLIVLAVAAWLVPLTAALVAISVLWGALDGPASVALGIVIVAAMPVANSSVGWATSMGGSVPLSIALLVVGTALSPLLTPLVIGAGAICLGTAEQALTQTPWSEGMGLFFLNWVLAPVVLGVFLANRLSLAANAKIVPVARRLSFSILIALNYLNGAPCLPTLAQEPHLLLWPLLASATLLILSFAIAQLWPRLLTANLSQAPAAVGLAAFSASREVASREVASRAHLVNRADIANRAAMESEAAEQLSFVLSVVMRNTGAALVFAGAALPDYVLVSLTIIAYTMLQHCWVGFFLSPQTSGPKA